MEETEGQKSQELKKNKPIMIFLRSTLFLLASWTIISFNLYSQGCSDAGFCTINSLKDHSLSVNGKMELKSHMKIGLTYGIGDFNIKIISPYLEYGNRISERLNLSAKVTFARTSGELNTNNNPGDVFLTSVYRIKKFSENHISMVTGLKIPLNDANIKDGNQPLPMNYQSSLGTFDFIFGLNLLYSNLGVSFALQQPLINLNKNEFLAQDDIETPLAKYQSANSYKRKGDILNRISYKIPLIGNTFSLRPSLLSIFHLEDDSFTDQNDSDKNIDGSKGLTLNSNVFITYNISDSKSIEIVAGTPFVTRESRPDGLTREFVLGVEYRMFF